MRTYLMTLEFEIWGTVKNGYTTPKTPPIDTTRNKLNAKAMNEILNGLVEL